MATHLKAGDPAPDFSAPGTDGQMLSLSDFCGQKLVLFFYPRDDSPYCTRQACSLRDSSAEISACGAAILGVSAQDEGSHQKFAEKHRLKFPLLADTDLAIAKIFNDTCLDDSDINIVTTKHEAVTSHLSNMAHLLNYNRRLYH